MEIIGFIASVLMGFSLGLIGGGGSILTVPILVYLFGINPVLSTAYSLFIVGATSMVGTFSHFKSGNIDVKAALIFGIPSIAAIFSVRKFLVPIIPDPIISVDHLTLSKDHFILMLFAVLMVLAAALMIRKPKGEKKELQGSPCKCMLILFEGIVVGGLAGIVGAGGGFLIIPSLILFAHLPMKKAVGTSLFIIAMNSSIGFLGDVGSGMTMDFEFMILFSGLAIAGIIIGSYFSKFISNEKLKPAFGWFVLAVGLVILTKEAIINH